MNPCVHTMYIHTLSGRTSNGNTSELSATTNTHTHTHTGRKSGSACEHATSHSQHTSHSHIPAHYCGCHTEMQRAMALCGQTVRARAFIGLNCGSGGSISTSRQAGYSVWHIHATPPPPPCLQDTRVLASTIDGINIIVFCDVRVLLCYCSVAQ